MVQQQFKHEHFIVWSDKMICGWSQEINKMHFEKYSCSASIQLQLAAVFIFLQIQISQTKGTAAEHKPLQAQKKISSALN